jgi:hypothetical protein
MEKKFTCTLEMRKTQSFKKPLENDERLSECFEFDLGAYPLTPWLNNDYNDKALAEMKSFSYFLPPKPG